MLLISELFHQLNLKKTDMKQTILLLSIVLSGCMYQKANNTDITKAIEACVSVDNVDYIEIRATGSEVAKCKTGEEIILDKYKMKKSF